MMSFWFLCKDRYCWRTPKNVMGKPYNEFVSIMSISIMSISIMSIRNSHATPEKTLLEGYSMRL